MSHPLITHLKRTDDAYRRARIGSAALGISTIELIARAVVEYTDRYTTIDYSNMIQPAALSAEEEKANEND